MAKLWFSRPSNWSSLAPPTDPEAAAVPVLSSDPADAGKGIDAYTGSPLPGGSGARTFYRWGDGTAGTIALPPGVTAPGEGFGAYSQHGRLYFFGAVSVDLDSPDGASA